MMGDDATLALGWTPARWWVAFETGDHWFKITGKGIDLTAAGKREALRTD